MISPSKRAFLPFAKPTVGEEEEHEVLDTLRSGWLTTGAKAQRFEKDFAKYVGVRHALAVNSATSGLHLALEAVGVRAGDKVITTPYTFTASAEVIRYLGADPVFVDIDPLTFNMDPHLVSRALRSHSKIKALLPVHFAGQACDMSSLLKLSREFDVPVVEDAAHALPATYDGRMVGSIGDLTVFSFYANKTITTGEGGMVVTNNDAWAQRMRTMRLHGISRDVFNRYTADRPTWYYEVIAPGFKYNMPDIAAAIGIHQLAKSELFWKRRNAIAQMYNQAFAGLPLRVPHVERPGDRHAWHLYVIQLKLEQLRISRDRFIEQLFERGIGTSVHFIPLHVQPYWRDRYNFTPDSFPNAWSAYQRAVSLPIYPAMTDEDVDRVIEAVREVLIQYAR